jgi:hypothetical protein
MLHAVLKRVIGWKVSIIMWALLRALFSASAGKQAQSPKKNYIYNCWRAIAKSYTISFSGARHNTYWTTPPKIPDFAELGLKAHSTCVIRIRIIIIERASTRHTVEVVPRCEAETVNMHSLGVLAWNSKQEGSSVDKKLRSFTTP